MLNNTNCHCVIGEKGVKERSRNEIYIDFNNNVHTSVSNKLLVMIVPDIKGLMSIRY